MGMERPCRPRRGRSDPQRPSTGLKQARTDGRHCFRGVAARCRKSREDGMCRASSAQARIVRAGVHTMELEEAPMTIVMGLDQHRAQITTEWIDTVTGEVGRARVTPAHREGVRRFFGRFAGQELEVALEATTGW